MAKYHRYKFWGQNIALIIYSNSIEEPYVFMQWIKRKKEGLWEKPKDKEGRYIKFSLDEIVIILKILDQERYEWKTTHIFNEEETEIVFNWEDKTYERLWLKIPEYSKVLDSANAEVLRLLLNHILQEKIEHATSYKKIENHDNKGVNFKNFSSNNKHYNLNDISSVKNNDLDDNSKSKNKIKGLIKKETEKAILIILDSGEEKWIPKSTIHNSFVNKHNIIQEFIVDTWILEKNDLIK